jgi:hypothetical protein
VDDEAPIVARLSTGVSGKSASSLSWAADLLIHDRPGGHHFMNEFTGDQRSRTVRAFLALSMILLSATACTSKATTKDAGAASEPAVAPSSSAAAPAATAAAGTYKIPAKPCTAIDTTSLAALTGRPVREEPGKTNKSSISSMTNCSVVFKAYALNAEIDFAEPDGTLIMYQGLRKAEEGGAKTTDIAGLGQGAYSYLDPATGPNVVAYDGNLYLSLNLGSISLGGGQPGAEAIGPLTETLKATMARLGS